MGNLIVLDCDFPPRRLPFAHAFDLNRLADLQMANATQAFEVTKLYYGNHNVNYGNHNVKDEFGKNYSISRKVVKSQLRLVSISYRTAYDPQYLVTEDVFSSRCHPRRRQGNAALAIHSKFSQTAGACRRQADSGYLASTANKSTFQQCNAGVGSPFRAYSRVHQ